MTPVKRNILRSVYSVMQKCSQERGGGAFWDIAGVFFEGSYREI